MKLKLKPQKILKQFASLKLAIVIILFLACLIAVGTIIESKYNAAIAAKLVYKTPLMFFSLGLLALSLTAVMIDRWPWQRKHLPFILAHIGIIVLLFGSVLTMVFGIDGTMRIALNEKNNFVTLPNMDLVVYTTFDGSRFTELYRKEVDFYLRPPQKNTYKVTTDAGDIQVVNYRPFVSASRRIGLADKENRRAGSAVRFQIYNDKMNTNEWLFQRNASLSASRQLGLAHFHLVTELPEAQQSQPALNQLFFQVLPSGEVKYLQTFQDVKKKARQGVIKETGVMATGWMNLELKILRSIHKAEEKWDFQDLERPNEMSTSVIEIQFQDKKYLLQEDDVIKIFTDKAAYYVSWVRRMIDVGFPLYLKNFEIGRYQGTQRASSYKSIVETPDLGATEISMNEPLKHRGLTFYQASFQEDEMGRPTATILSVNQDPGRWWKYLGSLIMSLGIIFLFYDKRKVTRRIAPAHLPDEAK